MAIITPSSLISEIRGSVGDVVFSRNKYRAYTKARTIPTNPDTPPQQAVRGYFRDAAQIWQLLSPENHLAWNQIAADYNTHSRLGSAKKMTGFNAWMRQYYYVQLGVAYYSEEPLLGQPIPDFTNTNFFASITAISLTGDLLPPSNGLGVLLFLSPPVSKGITSVNSTLFKLLGQTLTPGTSLSFDLLTSYQLIYNININDYENEQIFWKMKFIDVNTGENRIVNQGSAIISS